MLDIVCVHMTTLRLGVKLEFKMAYSNGYFFDHLFLARLKELCLFKVETMGSSSAKRRNLILWVLIASSSRMRLTHLALALAKDGIICIHSW